MSTRIDWDKAKRRDRAKRTFDPIASFRPRYTRKQWLKHKKRISASRKKRGGVR